MTEQTNESLGTSNPMESGEVVAENGGDNSGGMIDEARKVSNTLQANLKEYKELLDRHEALRIKEQLAGKADAGKPKEEKPAEETPREYMESVMRGDHNVTGKAD